MKHKVLSVQEPPSFPAVCGTVRGGMTTQDTATTVEIRDNAYWPDEAVLTDFAEQDVRVEQDARAKKDDREEQADSPLEDNLQYATLYFVL